MSKAGYFLRDYRDYLEACRGLGFDLRQTYYLFPKPDTFRARHDSVCAQWSIEQDRVREEKALTRDKHLLKVFASAQKKAEEWLTPLNASGSFLIRYPVSADEVRAEGKVLNHCVGSYLDKLDSGQTQVLFIRKKAAPDEPFYTVEFNGGKVIQCRGKHFLPHLKSAADFFAHAL